MAEPFANLGRRASEKLRLPPHSVEAERSVLGGLMLDHRAWDLVADAVEAADFYRADHRLIFSAIATLVERDQPPDAITVGELLARQGELDAAGGLDYLAQLVEETPSAANIRAYARIVRERAMLRQLIEIGGDIAASAHEEGGRTVEELVDLAEQRVFEIADRGQRRGSGFVALKHILPKTIDRLDVLSHSDGDITGISTGFGDMDRMTAGLQRGDLIIIAGRPSMGKCIVAGSRILDPVTGRLEPIDERVRRRHGDLVAVNRRGRLGPARASAFVDDGIKPVYEVRTALGRRIAVTASHPFLTQRGWRPLAELGAGVHVAVPRILPFFGERSLPDSLVKLAAYFVSLGGMTGADPRFTSADALIRADFVDAVRHFPGMRCRVEPCRDGRAASLRPVHDAAALRPTSRFGRRLRGLLHACGASLGAAAARLGTSLDAGSVSAMSLAPALGPAASVPGAGALDTIGPGVPDARVACNPPAHGTRPDREPEGLGETAWTHPGRRDGGANPIARWLATLGLDGQCARAKAVPDVVFELRREQIRLFLNRLLACDGGLDVHGERARIVYSTASERLARDVQHLLLRFGIVAKLEHRGGGACPPVHALHVVDENIARFAAEIGFFGERKAAAEAACLGGRADALDDEPRSLAAGDLYWDRIESIRYVGLEQVYDLTVPEHHNFVAEDVIVHNTTFAMNIAENAAIGANVPVAIFSMEMSAEQLSFRMIGSIGRVNQGHLRTGRLTDEDWVRIESAVSMMSNAPIFIDDSAGLTPTDVRARARRLKREHGLGLIVVDYLQLMQVAGTVENRATEISEISRSLKALAKELDVPVIALSQLNRSVEQRADKKPVMSDLRESGAIEQDADLIVFIYREEVYDPDTPRKGIADIIIGKQRNGPIGEFHLTFLGEFTKFENLVAEAYGEGVF